MFRARVLSMTLLVLGITPITSEAALADDSLRVALHDHVVDSSWIYDDWEKARALARKTAKPIFAVFRCVP